ncbi:APC family permease [Mycobacterium sp. AZCC_0083]|uniref:APC family permease n=1 Tax=Mycobacterium sp. AZCC_0083 TaxID=2735882 RepID=UPI0018292EC0|nr:APC family permease [Mycobacterium sp. AZCC_0083]MBB5168489.1 amino acid transporter [Mycobacterium sp. AZCC_0083]
MATEVGATNASAGLQRTVGFWGLMFVSLGSIIGSGWLLSALSATQTAGPAAILSWVLAAAMLIVLALVFAELGGAYPVAGGSGRFPFYSHGAFSGFIAAWASWLQAVAIAPIEILAAIAYVNSVGWVNQHFNMLNDAGLLNLKGLIVATILLIAFTGMNLAGAKFMSESNGLVVVWKTAVPLLAIFVIAYLSFHPSNFTAGGSFMPFGVHGIFAALPLGVVFALQGFEQAVQLAGEAKNPQKDMSRAIITAMIIGALLYIALQAAFILAINPADVKDGWAHPLGLGGENSSYGAWYTLAIAVGAGWLAVILIIDAVVSPSGTGIVYIGTTARLTYALGELPELPTRLASTDRRGVPVWSIVVSAVIGWLCFGPFPSWSKLVAVVTGATAIMYAFAPIALAALRSRDGDRPRSYRMPFPNVLLPIAFISANLLLYWGSYDVEWKLDAAMVFGAVLFFVGAIFKQTYSIDMMRHGYWILPWLIGATIIGYFGNYGGLHPVFDGFIFGEWSDLVIVAAFSLIIYYWALAVAMPAEKVKAAVERDADQIEGGNVLPVPLSS